MGRHQDFWQVTQDALDFAFATYGVCDAALRHDLMQAYLQLDCYPEVSETLRQLKQRGYRTAILSNGSPTMLAAAIAHAGITHLIDVTLSVEACRHLQAVATGLSLSDRTVGRDSPRDQFSVRECLGCYGRCQCWIAGGMDQPFQSAMGTTRHGSRRGTPIFERFAGATCRRSRNVTVMLLLLAILSTLWGL
jgi:hypothetical protein